MQSNEATQKINQRKMEIEKLRELGDESPEFKKWQRGVEVLLKKVFGDKSEQCERFSVVRYYPLVYSYARETPQHELKAAYNHGLDEANMLLNSFVEELEEYGLPQGDIALKTEGGSTNDLCESDCVNAVLAVCNRLHQAIQPLKSRRKNKPAFQIQDEYDVQDIIHSLLLVNFQDIRSEESVPSHGGSNSRIDFLLRNEKIGLEIKMASSNLDNRALSEQLSADIIKYQAHQNCKTLICFVYDPKNLIKNPYGIESDLSKNYDGMEVKVVIRP